MTAPAAAAGAEQVDDQHAGRGSHLRLSPRPEASSMGWVHTACVCTVRHENGTHHRVMESVCVWHKELLVWEVGSSFVVFSFLLMDLVRAAARHV